MQKGGPARQPQPTWPGVQGLVGLTKILGLELGLPEAPLRGPWGVIWRSVPPVLSWSPQRATPSLAGCPLLFSGLVGGPGGGRAASLVHCGPGMGVGGGGGPQGHFVLLQDAAPEPSPF